jgi:adenylate cyclase
VKESPLRNALRRVQDIIAEAKGSPLSGDAERRLERVLDTLGGDGDETSAPDNFSRRHVTILLADLRGFTSMTASYPAGMVLELLNRCFVRMSGIIVRHSGMIDKFMGDSIMVIFFGDPAEPGKDVRHAVECAADMQIDMDAINRAQRSSGMPELFMGIGLNTGQVMAGLLGSGVYSAYTVIGEDVNLASRIEAFSLRGQVLMSEETCRLCGDFAQTGEPMEVYVKGRTDRVWLRELLALPALGKTLPRQEVRRSPRVEVRLPFSFQRVSDKIIVPGEVHGVVLDIGYHGALAEVIGQRLDLYEELRVSLDLPLVAYRASDIYARVVKVVQKGERTLFGLEFSSLSAEASRNIQLFVQMLIQGGEARAGARLATARS